MTTPIPDHLLAMRTAVGRFAAELARECALARHGFDLKLRLGDDALALVASTLDVARDDLELVLGDHSTIEPDGLTRLTGPQLETLAGKLSEPPGELLMILVTFAEDATFRAVAPRGGAHGA